MRGRYLVIYETCGTNLSGIAPDISGSASAVRSLDEMRANLHEALGFHLAAFALDGQPMPLSAACLAEIPEDKFAEWLDVEVPVAQAVSA